jgi:hypothetical protein
MVKYAIHRVEEGTVVLGNGQTVRQAAGYVLRISDRRRRAKSCQFHATVASAMREVRRWRWLARKKPRSGSVLRQR